MKPNSLLSLLAAVGLASTGCFSFGMGMSVSDPPPPPPGSEVAQPQPTDAPGEPPAATVCEVGDLTRCTGLCNEGDGMSCNNLGATYEMGEGVEADLERALDGYDKGCAAGADAGCQNGVRLRNGGGVGPAAKPAPSAAPAPTSSWGI